VGDGRWGRRILAGGEAFLVLGLSVGAGVCYTLIAMRRVNVQLTI
jgi:hypothetical protein